MVIHVLLMLALSVLVHSAHRFLPPGEEQSLALSTTLAFGFVLLSALLAGRIAERLSLPRITGYLLMGVVAGPFVIGVLTDTMVRALQLVNGIAICLIAITAGGELNWRRLRPLFGTLRALTLWAIVGTFVLLSVGVFALSPRLSFLDGMSLAQRLSVSALLGATLAAQSPAVVMALLDETRADGPLSRTLLAMVVLSDLLIVVLYAALSSLANVTLGTPQEPLHTALEIGWELFGSIAGGLLVGLLMSVYLRKVEEGTALFVLLVCLVISQVGAAIHLDPLLVALTAGLFIENVTEIEASHLIHRIESASLPVYVVFFAVTGATLRLDLLWSVAIPALILATLRAVGFWAGSRVAASRTQAQPAVRRYTWIGLLPQAGLALAFALLLERAHPSFGKQASALVLAIIGINQLLPPVLLRFALIWSDEVGKRPALSVDQ